MFRNPSMPWVEEERIPEILINQPENEEDIRYYLAEAGIPMRISSPSMSRYEEMI